MRLHAASRPVLIRLRAGDVVTAGRRHEHWTDWLRCSTADGRQSWMPDKCLV